MPVNIVPPAGARQEERSLAQAMRRGFAQTCPACGEGRQFKSYLKVTDKCSSCGEELHHHRADDAPPYFTITIVGHIAVAGVLALEDMYAPPSWVHALIWIPLIVLLSLWMLPRIKGALVGLQWAFRMHGFAGKDDTDSIEFEPQPADAAR